ncbi:MAG: type II toxin-antitoxin system RelE/ParE family toxin [Pseudomonadota bacterium]|nr:type II toxin-antitoxin system RelE/ParE family toxin [Gammaproteobacteria bacterium]MDQ3582511.1 type II toxin-antitoxin system RelE/ParE family toxin [Pseudomonadota bacterium]
MTYRLLFKDEALKEWRKLDGSIREQFQKKLRERLAEPRVEAARLSGMPNCYKIKLKSPGYRLVYQVRDETVTVVVIAIAKRERNLVYKIAVKRV